MCWWPKPPVINVQVGSNYRIQQVVTRAYDMGRNGPYNTTVVLPPLHRQGRSSKSTYRKSTVSKRSEAEKNKIRNARLVKLGGHDKANAGSL